MAHFQIQPATSQQDISGILKLQKQNLANNLSAEEARSQGFVTLEHDFDLLHDMNQQHPHIIALCQGQVVGYALVMLQDFSDRFPLLFPLFERIEQLTYQNQTIKADQYFIMGQVCVAKSHRSQGVFAALYQGLKQQMAPHFDYMITDISSTNTRSIRAHEKFGFETIDTYSSDGTEWQVVLLNLQA